MSFPPLVDGASEQLRRKILQSLLPKGMGDKFAGGVAERLDEELNSLIQDYETIKEFADFLANSTPEQRQALLNKYGDAAKKLFTDSEYRGQVGEAIVEAFKEGITDDIEKFTRIKSGDEKDIGYTTTHAALMAYGVWKRYGKKIGKDVVRAVDDDVAKNTVDSKTLKKAKDGVGEKGGGQVHHLISNKIDRALNSHPTLKGVFDRENPLFKYTAKNLDTHKGYQTWHRQYDKIVTDWLSNNPAAKPQQFQKYLHDLHQQDWLKDRIPNVNLRGN